MSAPFWPRCVPNARGAQTTSNGGGGGRGGGRTRRRGGRRGGGGGGGVPVGAGAAGGDVMVDGGGRRRTAPTELGAMLRERALHRIKTNASPNRSTLVPKRALEAPWSD